MKYSLWHAKNTTFLMTLIFSYKLSSVFDETTDETYRLPLHIICNNFATAWVKVPKDCLRALFLWHRHKNTRKEKLFFSACG